MSQTIMYPPHQYSPITELAADIGPTDLNLTVTAPHLLPVLPNYLVLTDQESNPGETVLALELVGSTVNLTSRGGGGTARGWSAGTIIWRPVLAEDHEAFTANIEDLASRMNATESPLEPDENGDIQPTVPRSWLELDGTGNIMPALEAANDPEFELDGIGNIQPRG